MSVYHVKRRSAFARLHSSWYVRQAGGRATGWVRQTRLDRGEEWRLEQHFCRDRGAHPGNGRPDRTLHRSYTAELAWGRV